MKCFFFLSALVDVTTLWKAKLWLHVHVHSTTDTTILETVVTEHIKYDLWLTKTSHHLTWKTRLVLCRILSRFECNPLRMRKTSFFFFVQSIVSSWCVYFTVVCSLCSSYFQYLTSRTHASARLSSAFRVICNRSIQAANWYCYWPSIRSMSMFFYLLRQNKVLLFAIFFFVRDASTGVCFSLLFFVCVESGPGVLNCF